jgi:hypothetical protein
MINNENITNETRSESKTARKQWITPELTSVKVSDLTHAGTGVKSDGVTPLAKS